MPIVRLMCWTSVEYIFKSILSSSVCALGETSTHLMSQYVTCLLVPFPSQSFQPLCPACSHTFLLVADACLHAAPMFWHSHFGPVSDDSAFFGREIWEQSAMSADRRSPSQPISSDWGGGRSPSRSKSRSKSRSRQPPSPQAEWMATTAQRLDAGAEAAELAAVDGGEDLKALYMMSQKDINVAASSQPDIHISETLAFRNAQESSQPLLSHYEAGVKLHRMTGGGQKLPSTETGALATALNPSRHLLMIQGRPVGVLGVERQRHTASNEFSALAFCSQHRGFAVFLHFRSQFSKLADICAIFEKGGTGKFGCGRSLQRLL